MEVRGKDVYKRQQLIVEEAWKALSSANMAEYLRYMYTVSYTHLDVYKRQGYPNRRKPGSPTIR